MVNVHSPPISSSETSSVRARVAAAARAAPSPAAPPPITTRSQLAGTGQPAAPGDVPAPDAGCGRYPATRSPGTVPESTWTPLQNATWFLILRASGLGCG